MLKLAIDGIVNFSEKPLYIASYVGFFISFVSIIWGISIFYNYFSGNFVGVLGWSSIMVSILFIGGLQIAFIGLIGLYLGRTYGEVRGRPLYVISDKIGFVNA
jgi:dolichol-phosphate mannosyltransferase